MGVAAPEPSPSGEDAPAAPKPGTKAAQGQATTAALTAAARELFADRGYAAVGTEEIVKRAGVTRGALYHHFRGGKEELFRAVLVQLSAETMERVMHAAAATPDPFEELVLGAEAFLDACMNPEVQRIMLTDGPAVLGWEVWRAIDEDYAIRLLERVLEKAIAAGQLAPQPTRAVAYVVVGALEEAAMTIACADDPPAAREEMGRTVDRLLAGLRAPLG